MKCLLLFGLLLLPVFGFSQLRDSVRVAREVDSLIQISRTLAKQGIYVDALQVIEVAKKKATDFFGVESAGYARCVNNQGRVYYVMGKYSEAEPLYLKAKAIQEKVLGKEHPDYAASLNSLAILYRKKREFDKAEPLFLEAQVIQEKVLGKDHSAYISNQISLANLYSDKGEYDKAEQLHLEAKSIRERVLGKNHPDYAQSLNDLAAIYSYKGEYDKEEQLGLEAKSIRERILGKNHPDYAQSLNNLGSLYIDKGEYDKAEQLILEAKTIREKVLGKEHPDYTANLNSLAILYSKIGKYDRSLQLHLEAKSIREKVLGKEHPDYAISVSNLATVYHKKGEYDEAILLQLEAKAIWEKVLGKEHPRYATSLNNLGNIYRDKGEFGKAEPLILEAKSIREKVLGKEHPIYAESLNNMATIYRDKGEYDKATPLYLEAQVTWQKVLGKAHPNYTASLYNLAGCYWEKGSLIQAESYFLSSNTDIKNLIQKSAAYSSEKEMLQFQALFEEQLDALLHFTQIYPTDSLILAAYDNTLFFGNALLDAAIEREKGIARAESSTRSLYSDFKSVNFQLNKWYNRPVVERDSSIVTRLEERARLAEKELVRRSPEFVDTRRTVTWQEVRDQLQPAEAAIEFIHYRFSDKKTTDSTMYAALVLLPGNAAPQFITLFEERELASLLKGASGKAFTRINALYAAQPVNNAQKSLYDLIWKPLEMQLDGVKRVYYSPSGLLHRLNLGAITIEKNKKSETFADMHSLVLLGSTRRLVIPDNTVRTGNNAQLFGGIRYTTDSTVLATANFSFEGTRGLASETISFHRDSTLRSDSWNYLPETAPEVREIQHIFQSKNWTAQLDTGYLATEEAFRNIGKDKPSPRSLHIATHGFFFPDPKTTANDRRRMVDGGEPIFKLSDHPMIRSGLILAGAQQAWSTGKPPEGREDGILTAYEISQMNLSNTELVVLSACETGLGDIAGNEGVYGLQRAFKIAGAKYLIMSLWKVSDQSSRELMTDFYQQWLREGLTIPHAFRKAQANMKQKYPDAPYHWAGFILLE